jgi:ribosomal protein S18 acetylase RimI-like enzyme
MLRLEPVWQAIVAALAELEAAAPLSAALTSIDAALEQRGFAQRIRARLHAADAAAVTIVGYQRRYRADFKRLNLEWLGKYFRVEPIDERVLSRPEAIVRKGGTILLACLHGKAIGTCALLPAGTGRYELSKMAITEAYQGLGIGRRLLAAAIGAFEAGGGGELFLETNSVLAPAIRLYESVGFVHMPRPDGPAHYQRANVYMAYRGGLPASRFSP